LSLPNKVSSTPPAALPAARGGSLSTATVEKAVPFVRCRLIPTIFVATAQQIFEAFPWNAAPTYLVRDNDRVYGQAFTPRLRTMGDTRPPDLTEVVPLDRRPPVGGTEMQAYNDFLNAFTRMLEPRDEMELIWTKEAADATWEAGREAREKMA
jgi:hypothetical protein